MNASNVFVKLISGTHGIGSGQPQSSESHACDYSVLSNHTAIQREYHLLYESNYVNEESIPVVQYAILVWLDSSCNLKQTIHNYAN